MPTISNGIHALDPVIQGQLKGSGKGSPSTNKDRLQAACSEFESLFVSYMMQQMRETVPQDGLLQKSQAEKIYTGMLDNEIAKSISTGRGLGLAKAMYEQLSAIYDRGNKKI